MGKYLSTLSIDYQIDRHHRPRIELNGQPVPGLHAVTVKWEHGSATVATLSIFVDELHVSAETMIQLRATLEARQPETRPTVVAPLPGDEDE